MRQLSRPLPLLLLLLVLSGCTIKQHLKYDLDEVTPTNRSRVNAALTVTRFSDARAAHPPSAVLFRESRDAKIDGKRRCLNAEEHYHPAGRVQQELSELIASHLNRRGVVKHASTDSAGSDYTLRGEVRALYGMQDFSDAAATGAAFGLIGALATAGSETEGTIHIDFSKLSLLDARGKVVASLPPVVVNVQRQMPADAYCWAIFRNVNLALRDAIEQLSQSVEEELARLSSPATSAPIAASSGGEAARQAPAPIPTGAGG